ncbi:hypothetical protein C8F01DRAFT_667529 [Mycena amicta]|nr:hypothetical protein C8F01DRAFT_667529 [Mycena amicta]
MPQSANEVYQRLASQKHGIPLFTPEPNENLPAEYQQVGVSIGDVGVLRDGSFEVLFNTCRPTEHSINGQFGVPEGFELFKLDKSAVSKRMYHSPGSIITTAAVCEVSLGAGASSIIPPCLPASAGSSVTLSFRSKVGAALVLPQGASRENLLPVARFRNHVQRHAEQWYAFAQTSGFHPEPLPTSAANHNGHGNNDEDALFVVTGCDKTSAWGIATASSLSASVGFSLKVALVGLVEGTLEPKFEWHQTSSATIRTSSHSDADALGPENQCVFVRGFFVPRRPRIMTWRYVLNRLLARLIPMSIPASGRPSSVPGHVYESTAVQDGKKAEVITHTKL